MGEYHYKHIPMEVSNSPEIMWQKMNDLFQGFEFIYSQIENILIIKHYIGQIMYINWNLL